MFEAALVGIRSIPPAAQYIIDELKKEGYKTYVVGGCVRDSLLGKVPHDWDICTDAMPSATVDLFTARCHKVVETGIKHGTVTIVADGEPYEVTTFRKDGDYTDNRHPDTVEFVSDLYEDLARRDFTINAMAFDGRVLLDPFGGKKDLAKGILRCVGDPDERFSEDALRVLRAMRFASMYGLRIEKRTSIAVHSHAQNLNNISCERIYSELCKLLQGKNAAEILRQYSDVLSVVIPEISPCIGFDQKNPYHCFDVYEHTLHALDNYNGNDLAVKWTLLLHDIGKPSCLIEDEKGGHFYGHPEVSAQISSRILERLRVDNRTKSDVVTLVRNHDATIEPTEKSVRKWLSRLGPDLFFKLLDVKMADIKAHIPGSLDEQVNKTTLVREIANKIVSEQQCFSLKDLAINGDDLMAMGIPEGKQIGRMLHQLLNYVVDGKIANRKEDLLAAAKSLTTE